MGKFSKIKEIGFFFLFIAIACIAMEILSPVFRWQTGNTFIFISFLGIAGFIIMMALLAVLKEKRGNDERQRT